MSKQFDIIVVGVGSMGSATCYELANAGLKVLGLEAHDLVNDEASHSGQTRIVRKAYFEHPDYVPLLNAAYQGWERLEAVTGKPFYHPVGLAYFGKQKHPLLQSVKDSSTQYNIPLKTLNEHEKKKLLPEFNIPGNYETLLEPEAGFVCTDQVIRAYAELARAKGASINENEPVLEWAYEQDKVKVTTPHTAYFCDKLILTGGAGNRSLLPKTMASLKVTRQLISWVNPKVSDHLVLGKLPCWVLAPEDENGIYYGFPMLPVSFGGPKGLKIAHHFPGEEVNALTEEAISDEKQKIQAMMNTFMSDVLDDFIDVTTCLYTYSTDENFIIDFVPETQKKVIAAAGFSGHGFKFVPIIGEVLKDLALTGKTAHPVGFLQVRKD